MKALAIVTLITAGLALAGCGAGVGFNTPLGGAAVSGNIGNPPPLQRPLY